MHGARHVALATGGTSGIRADIARRLATDGLNVVVHSRSSTKVGAVAVRDPTALYPREGTRRLARSIDHVLSVTPLLAPRPRRWQPRVSVAELLSKRVLRCRVTAGALAPQPMLMIEPDLLLSLTTAQPS